MDVKLEKQFTDETGAYPFTMVEGSKLAPLKVYTMRYTRWLEDQLNKPPSKKVAEEFFIKGGDWRISCKNLTDGVISKLQWSEEEDFEDVYERISERYNTH